MKNGLKIFRSYIQLDETLTKDDNFTIFVSFLHDTSLTTYIAGVGLGYKPSDSNALTPVLAPSAGVTADRFMISPSSKIHYEETLPSAYRNERLFFWFCKQGSTFKAIICQGGHINKTITSYVVYATRVALNFPYKVQRVGFSKNFYNLYEKEFHKISFLEKANGTFFLLNH